MIAATPQPIRQVLPGPSALHLLWYFIASKLNGGEFLRRCIQRHGDAFFCRLPRGGICLLANPELIEEVLVKNNSNFVKSRDYRALRALVGNGLLTSEGEFWHAQRKRIHPTFRHEKIAAYAQIMTDLTQEMLAKWKQGETRDVYEEMTSLTFEIVTNSLFGSDISERTQLVRQALSAILQVHVPRVTFALIMPQKIPIPKGRRLTHSLKQLDQIAYSLIRARRDAKTKTHDDLLQALLEAQDEDGNRMSDEQLRDEVVTLLFAGHETTASALSWTWYLLAQNPEKEDLLLAEIRAVLGNRVPTIADLARLPYTEMVIKESLRLYPPAWAFGRQAIRSCELGRYRIPARTNVMVLPWIMHRDGRFFSDPECFQPERWRNDPVRNGTLPRGVYLPFGGGPRVCVGAAFAMIEAKLLLACIAQRFRFTLIPHRRIALRFAITLGPKNGLPTVLHERV